jgi:hypothetical protein
MAKQQSQASAVVPPRTFRALASASGERANGLQKKEKIMLKRTFMGVLLTTLLVSVAVSAQAQSQATIVSDVPFNFYVGEESLPAGACTVKATNGDGSMLIIRSSEGGKSMITLSNSATGKQGRARLIFNKYGDQYFLRAVWSDGREGRMLSESGRERRLRRELREVAGRNAARPEVLIVIARYEAR